MGTATSATCSPTVRRRPVVCATASTQRRCGSSPVMTWRRKGTGGTSACSTKTCPTKRSQRRDLQEGDPGRWVLLGDGGLDPQAAGGDQHPGRLHRRRERERHVSQPPRA